MTLKFPPSDNTKKVCLCKGHGFSENFTACRPLNQQGVWQVAGLTHRERNPEMEYVLCGSDCPSTVYLISSSRVCNREVNQHDTRTSITQTPFGVTCLLLESTQRIEKKNVYILINDHGYRVCLFQLISAIGCTL